METLADRTTRCKPGWKARRWSTRPATIASPYPASPALFEPLSEDGWTPIGDVLGGVMKEIGRRAELRQRLEAERGVPINNEAFLEIAEKTGGIKL